MPITIENDLTIYHVATLRERLAAQMATLEKITINMQAVKKVDIAGIQLLLAMKRSTERQGKPFHLDNAPPCVVNAVKLTGFDRELLFTAC